MDQNLLRISGVARVLRISDSCTRRLIRDGLIPSVRVGRQIRVKAEWMRERPVATSAPVSAPSSFAERHYSVPEVAGLWNLSSDAVRKLFQNEPGVVVLGGQDSTHKRRYTTLRIPESVLQRVYRS